jgi:hypothetical protein
VQRPRPARSPVCSARALRAARCAAPAPAPPLPLATDAVMIGRSLSVLAP